ncbi:MAG: hypothetical protein AB7U44_06620 [Sulfuricurvum sp.]|jgi:type IV secretory pathway component VirB8|uniref:hypothetical protein n=1 Tax=Sulfuricurvum sp. TaxID=2025608 RepID=UPI00261FBFFD|nr:hypothetical protein [Sulfuricurvum sp.]MDD2838119.1 hypothetical protein [Sulfuricurvum sp.]MDD3595126.1 hypothetical protein [Sulfuricurvum sp.]MDD4883237.1 hypothetical protein [Sulfuricurvum sp.]
MDDEKLKIVLALLSGIVFSLIFILLAFVLPIKDTSSYQPPKHAPKGHLEKISHELQK